MLTLVALRYRFVFWNACRFSKRFFRAEIHSTVDRKSRTDESFLTSIVSRRGKRERRRRIQIPQSDGVDEKNGDPVIGKEHSLVLFSSPRPLFPFLSSLSMILFNWPSCFLFFVLTCKLRFFLESWFHLLLLERRLSFGCFLPVNINSAFPERS